MVSQTTIFMKGQNSRSTQLRKFHSLLETVTCPHPFGQINRRHDTSSTGVNSTHQDRIRGSSRLVLYRQKGENKHQQYRAQVVERNGRSFKGETSLTHASSLRCRIFRSGVDAVVDCSCPRRTPWESNLRSPAAKKEETLVFSAILQRVQRPVSPQRGRRFRDLLKNQDHGFLLKSAGAFASIASDIPETR